MCVLVHLQACIWYRLACDSLTRKCGHDSWTSYLDFCEFSSESCNVSINSGCFHCMQTLNLILQVSAINTLWHCIGLSLHQRLRGIENTKKMLRFLSFSLFCSYGDIRALTTNEKWFASFSMLAGIALFGFILGGLASRLTNADSVRFRYTHLFNTVRDYLVRKFRQGATTAELVLNKLV